MSAFHPKQPFANAPRSLCSVPGLGESRRLGVVVKPRAASKSLEKMVYVIGGLALIAAGVFGAVEIWNRLRFQVVDSLDGFELGETLVDA